MEVTLASLFRFIFGILVSYILIKLISQIKKLFKSAEVVSNAKSYYLNKKVEFEKFANQIPKVNLSEELINKVLQSNISQLKQMLKNNLVTSEQLVNIFSFRAATIGSKLNLITDLVYDEAIAQAKACDSLRKSNPEACQGEMFGIPISFKEQIEVKGKASTWGCYNQLKKISKEDGTITKLIKMAGGIPFALSNLPQCAMDIESQNNIFGRAQNPWDTTRTTGGSSGGEGGLIASCCSPVGIGTDIGGSIRIPSAFCGCVGFKPTSERLSMKGINIPSPSFRGFHAVGCCVGPLGKSVEDCAIVLKTLLNENTYGKLQSQEKDLYFSLKPFNEQQFLDRSKKFRIGYFKSQEMFTSHQAQIRAIDIAKDNLQKLGHELFEIKFPKIIELMQLFSQVQFSDNLSSYNEILGNEPLIKAYQQFDLMCHTPLIIKKLLKKVLSLLKQDRLASSITSISGCSAKDYRIYTNNLQELQKEIASGFLQLHLDAILSPGFGMPALKHGLSSQLIFASSATIMWNVMNFPTGVVPITTIAENEQHYDNDIYKDLIHNFAVKNMKQSIGLPVAVQISTYPFEEEKCLNIMKQLEEQVQFQQNHPYKTNF